MLRENLELKELCLYLDKERENGGGGGEMDGPRDQGDGSSNSTSDGQVDGFPNGRQQQMEDALNRQKGGLNGNYLCAMSVAIIEVFKIKCMTMKIYSGIISQNVATYHIMNRIDIVRIAKVN